MSVSGKAAAKKILRGKLTEAEMIYIDAYELAVIHGFEGTIEEWLESIKGEDGYTPIKGVDYFEGKDGKDGRDGIDGKDGYTPIKGVDYFDGKDGTVSFSDLTEEQKASLKGADGVSPTITVTDVTGGHRVTITDADGTESFDVMDGDGAVVTLEQLGGVSEEKFSVAETDISNLRSDVEDLFEQTENIPTDSHINGLIDAKIPTDSHINGLIDAKLGVIENGSY